MTQPSRTVLLMSGTADTVPLTLALVERGWHVLLSTFSTTPLMHLSEHPRITRRTGPLDTAGIISLIKKHGIELAIDALHPYATEGHRSCAQAALQHPCRWLRLGRPASELPSHAQICANHTEASAQLANFNRPVLLTIGSRHLAPYVNICRAAKLPLLARVLDDESSLEVCTQLGLKPHEVHAARGPFSKEENLAHIDRIEAGVLVSKDGGKAGGLPEKLAACAERNCALIVVARPNIDGLPTYSSLTELLGIL